MKPRKLKAITLVEQLVYLGIFGIFFIVVIEFAIDISSNNLAAKYRNMLERSNIYTYEHFEDSFYKADTIDPGNTTFNSDMGKIRLIRSIDGSYFDYKIQNSRLYFTSESGSNYLTNPNVIIDKLLFTPVYAPDNSLIGSKVEITFRNSKKSNITKNFETLFDL